MKFERIVVIYGITSILIFAFLISDRRTSADPKIEPLVQARAIQLVDENGKIRAQLDVEKNGEVVFRLRDKDGTIRAKFGADASGSGLILMDERTEATVRIRANNDGGNIALYTRDGKQNVLK